VRDYDSGSDDTRDREEFKNLKQKALQLIGAGEAVARRQQPRNLPTGIAGFRWRFSRSTTEKSIARARQNAGADKYQAGESVNESN
jgi:hypothetical protein